MGRCASPEKYEGEGLHHHWALFLVRAGCSATPHSTAAVGIAAPNKITAIAEAENTHRESASLAAESWQTANAQHKGALGLVSAGYGATPPTMYGVDPSVRRQNKNASALLALNPCSQNNQENAARAQVPPPTPHGGDAGVIGGGVEALGGHFRAVHDVVAVGANPPIIQVAAADPHIVQAAVGPPNTNQVRLGLLFLPMFRFLLFRLLLAPQMLELRQ